MTVSFIAVYQVMVYLAVYKSFFPSIKIVPVAPIAGAIIVSGVRSLFVGINAFKWHRNHLMRLRLGDREWLPPSLKTFDSCPTRATIGSLKFSGFQIAYSAINNMFVTAMLVSIFIVCQTYGGSLLLSFIKSYWPYFLSMSGVWLAQRLLVKYVFIQKKDGLVAIIRRRGFNHLSYFFFFFNSLLGGVSYILRLVSGLLLGLLFLERTQKSLIPRSFERFDRGYVSYLSYLHVEHTFGNPVLVVFVKLLNLCTQCSEFGKIQDANVVENVTGRTTASLERYHLARNRWFLAYTLIKNPALITFRGKNLPVATASEKDVVLNI
ncbi:stimulated by retinoic acid gene 6 protein-like [Rhopilema esculentum]|uniref:stimulated by retinoic acid gene 6 protein-like n=1 Tax=Rhopilema esculentum TaxID=499914 RepID=UPI0031D49B57